MACVCNNLDTALALQKPFTKHAQPKAEKDETVIYQSLCELRPYKKTSDQVCVGMSKVLSSPIQKTEDLTDLKYRISQIYSRAYYVQTMQSVDSPDEESDD